MVDMYGSVIAVDALMGLEKIAIKLK